MTTDWPPRVLSNLYRNGLQTFYDLLVGLISKSLQLSAEESGVEADAGDRQLVAAELRKQAEKKLVGEGDPADYLTLLHKSYAVMSEQAPTLGHVSFEQRWTQEQIVERVIVLQFRQEDKPSHVLCAGYRKLRELFAVGESSQRRCPHGLQCACENSSVDIVNSPSWKILLSRVGDLIMLHVLTHAAVFSPLPNNCFLQVLGSPTNRAVSIPGKFPSIHPGEKMLGGITATKGRSECHTSQYKPKGRPSYCSGVEDRGKQPDYNSESQADATTSIADESKQACAREEKEVAGVRRHQTSNFTLSHSLKRQRTESAETGMKMDDLEGCSKYHDLSIDKIDRKRQKCGSRDEVLQDNVSLQNGLLDTSNDTILEFAGNSSREMPAKNSRRAPEGTGIQYPVRNKRILDGDRNSHPNQFRKRRKLTNQTEKDGQTQQGKKLCRIADRGSIDSNAMVTQHLKGGKLSKKSPACSMQREGKGHENETGPQHPSHHDLGDSPVGQGTSTSPPQVTIAVPSGKRVRLSSWKRRKLRQTQESRKDSSLESCGEGPAGIVKQGNICLPQKAVAKVDEVISKPCKGESHSTASTSHQFQSGNFGCGFSFEEIALKKSLESMTPKQISTRKKPSHGLGGTDGTPERLIDRAPIFYNANYSCHPGLPAKHILSTAEPNEPGVARLFTAIFGAHCKISVCSSSRGHMYANCTGTKFKPGQSSQLKSVHELLRGILLNSRRCKFARLLGRHCPLPEGFHLTRKDKGSPLVSAVLSESQNLKMEEKGSELDEDAHRDEQQQLFSRGSASEIDKIMRIWLGANYQSPDKATAKHLETNSTSSSTVVEKRMECSPIGQQTTTSSDATTEHQKQDHAIETSRTDNLGTEQIIKQSALISCYTAHSKVVGFLWAVCRSIIPQEMLGCFRSWRALRSSIAHFVSLRRHEKFNVKHALFRLPLSSFSWLGFQHNEINSTLPAGKVAEQERALQQRRLEQWLYWLFTSLIVPLIRAHFYVTENENFRQDIFYYRKPVWARIRSNGLRELMSKNYKKLSKQAVAKLLNSRVLGFSQIRLLPKKAGLRPIANLAAASQGTLKFNIRTRAKATLRQVFPNLSKELLSGDCNRSDKLSSFPSQSASRARDVLQCVAVEPYEASPSADAEKSAVVANSLSCSPSPLAFVKPSVIQKRSKKSVNFSFRSINSVLKDAYHCLKLETEAHPKDLGSSVFGYSDIHERVLPFIMRLKQSLNGMPRLFMAVCDVTKAYDTIPQERLQEIVESFMQSSDYKVARYKCVTPTLASVRVSHDRACTPAGEPKKFVDSVRDLATKRSHCIFVDQAFSTTVTRDQVLAMLGEHVKQNIVQIGSHFYQQKVGIAQGSILSSLLCSLFYGHFDLHGLLPVVKSHSIEPSCHVFDSNDVFHGSSGGSDQSGPCLASSIAKETGLHDCGIEQLLELSLGVSETGQDELLGNKPLVSKEDESGNGLVEIEDSCMPSSCMESCEETGSFESNCVLLRLIDDSLFISTSERGAKIFVESMHRGSKEYGCKANERKTATSFCLQLGDKLLPRQVYKTEDGACFMRWSGLLVNCFTLEFQADYTRYCGEHIRSALTVRREKNQGLQLVLKMCHHMRPKCHPLFFDPRINSPATIRLNAFQAFLLCAMKFHAYVCCLPHVTEINEPFLYKAIDCAIRYMHGLLRHKMANVSAEAVASFPYKELEWLAFVAFYRVLSRKQARYQILLDMLQTQLQMPKYHELRACPHLASATNERRSSMFKFIKY